MNRSAQVVALSLLVVLLGHPLGAVCACWQGAPAEAAPAGSCHESTKHGLSVQDSGRDCCLVSPAMPAPPQPPTETASTPLLGLPNLWLAAAAETPEPVTKFLESPRRSPDSSLQALYCAFLI